MLLKTATPPGSRTAHETAQKLRTNHVVASHRDAVFKRNLANSYWKRSVRCDWKRLSRCPKVDSRAVGTARTYLSSALGPGGVTVFNSNAPRHPGHGLRRHLVARAEPHHREPILRPAHIAPHPRRQRDDQLPVHATCIVISLVRHTLPHRRTKDRMQPGLLDLHCHLFGAHCTPAAPNDQLPVHFTRIAISLVAGAHGGSEETMHPCLRYLCFHLFGCAHMAAAKASPAPPSSLSAKTAAGPCGTARATAVYLAAPER